MRYKITILFFALFFSINLIAKTQNKTQNMELETLYHKAQREFHRKNFVGSLPLLKSYIDLSRKSTYQRERLFWVIDQVGTIHLRVNKDPDAAIVFFTKMSKDKRLDEAESINLEEWISAAKDWKKLGRLPVNSTRDQLFLTGRKYFYRGIEKTKSPRDDEGNADFHISAAYLVPFITNHDSDARIGNALLMMGTIRRHVFTDNEYWSENFYLKEVIRRFPHTDLAMSAYKELEVEVHTGFTGSGGDNTPPSMVKMLKRFKKLAAVKKKA